MSEAEWDDVIRVHLKGHFAPSRWAAAYWREEAKSGRAKPRNMVHTSSTSGLFANPGQSNYGAAKSGIATFSQILAKELARYEREEQLHRPGGPHPADAGDARPRRHHGGQGGRRSTTGIRPTSRRSSPTCSTADCPFTGETFFVQGGVVKRVQSWEMAETVERNETWTVEALGEALTRVASSPS